MAKSPPSLTGTLAAANWLLLASLMITGSVLSSRYSPDIASAHASVAAMRDSSVFAPLHGFHNFGSALLILLSGINVLILLWNGKFTKEYRWLWWAGIGVAALAMFFQMTGNLLPFSQHDVRTAYIEAGIASQAPLVGENIKQLALGGTDVGQPTLDRWYLAHRLIAPIIALLIAIPAIRAIKTEIKSRSAIWIACIPILILVPAAFLVQSPLGDPAATQDFASGATKPMWYVLPMHSMLNFINDLNPNLGWIGPMLVPALLLLIAVALPFIFRDPRRRVTKAIGRLSAIFVVASVGLATLNFGSMTQSPFATEPAFQLHSPIANNDKPPIDETLAQKGEALVKTHNCVACHSIGDQKGGTLGPNLSGVGSKHPNADYFIELLKNPESKGITTMPRFDTIPEDELRALAEYLRSLN